MTLTRLTDIILQMQEVVKPGIFPVAALVGACFGTVYAEQGARIVMETIEVRKIWDKAPHNAFTDLIHFRGRWFCAFREGSAHVSPDGKLRVITSPDGTDWESAALITETNADLRDAKLCTTTDGLLMLYGGAALREKSGQTHQSLAWFSEDGRNWTSSLEIGEPDFWLWRITWYKEMAYGIGYACGPHKSLRLYRSRDGRKFEVFVERMFGHGYPSETSLFWEGERAYCLLRRDAEPSSALVGISRPPYSTWEWMDLGVRIGGPHVIRLRDGIYVAAVRLYEGGTRTSLCWLRPDVPKIQEVLRLPSGGDTGYAGLVFHDDVLWVSYYSSHEGKAAIYLARVKVLENTR